MGRSMTRVSATAHWPSSTAAGFATRLYAFSYHAGRNASRRAAQLPRPSPTTSGRPITRHYTVASRRQREHTMIHDDAPAFSPSRRRMFHIQSRRQDDARRSRSPAPLMRRAPTACHFSPCLPHAIKALASFSPRLLPLFTPKYPIRAFMPLCLLYDGHAA